MKTKSYLILGIFSIIFLLIFIFKIRSSPSSPSPSLTLQKSSGEFAYQNTNNNFQTYFKDSPLKDSSVSFKTGNSSISFYTLEQQVFGKLSSSSPETQTNTITYPNIFTDTDLKYTLSSQRLLEEFIVSSQPIALKFTQISQIAKVNNIDQYRQQSDGSIQFFYQGQLKFTLPTPVIYETKNKNKKNYGIQYQITKTTDNTYQIDKVLTTEGLSWLSNLNRDYPIAIDLVIDNADNSSSWVSSDPVNTVVTQDTDIKHEGTGSVKVQTTADIEVPLDLMEYSSDTLAQTTYVTNSLLAVGGTETLYDIYRVHTFLSSGTLTVTNSDNLEVLVVAGGGGGGMNAGGGGGGGGAVSNSSFSASTGDYSAVVGAGGTDDQNGYNSTFSTITAYGGGAGGDGLYGVSRVGKDGGCGGGAGGIYGKQTSYGGIGSQGYNGGNGYTSVLDEMSGGGGGGGMGAIGGRSGILSVYAGGLGGDGISSSISGTLSYYAGGGGGGGGRNYGAGGEGGIGGGVDGVGSRLTNTNLPFPNTGGGGGGGGTYYNINRLGSAGGSGIVIIRHLETPLQDYSESTIKTDGSYSLKGVAKTNNSLNRTLTRTLSSPVDISNTNILSFDIRSSRTGSNIKIGLHDSGGTTTEITPNITYADTWQNVTYDLTSISTTDRDAIDQIIITIVNADVDNTFYIDNLYAFSGSTNNTVSFSPSGNIDYMEYSSDTSAQTAYVTNSLLAVGGTETLYDIYRVHTFLSSGTLAITNSGDINTLVVGGGGAGAGGQGGGGGAGGVIYNSSVGVSTGYYPAEIGIGGTNESNGSSSTFNNVEAYGGGGGGNGNNQDGKSGACGGGAGGADNGEYLDGGIGSQGYNGGNSGDATPDARSGPGGGGGMGQAGENRRESGNYNGGYGGYGLAYSITGVSTYYGGGGGGGTSWCTLGSGGIGGIGGGGDGYTGSTPGEAGEPYTGGGGGGSCSGTGGNGGSGIVIISHLDTTLQSYSESTIKTQGSYSLKVVAKATNSLNQTLVKTFSSPLNLSDKSSITFDMRASRTGSNMKIGFHNSNGTTTEITPNITSANTWQNISLDISSLSSSAKDSIDQIIITVVNADADNTFYLDNFDSVGATQSYLNLSDNYLVFWIRSSLAGQTLRFQFGEASSSEQTYDITIDSANTWERKIWDISNISPDNRNQVSSLAFKITDSSSIQTFYFDDIQTFDLKIPSNCLIEKSSINTFLQNKWVDNTLGEDGYEIQKKVDDGSFSLLFTLDAGTTGYTDNDVSSGHIYQYRIAPYLGPYYAPWCETPTLDLEINNFQFNGLKMEGLKIN